MLLEERMRRGRGDAAQRDTSDDQDLVLDIPDLLLHTAVAACFKDASPKTRPPDLVKMHPGGMRLCSSFTAYLAMMAPHSSTFTTTIVL